MRGASLPEKGQLLRRRKNGRAMVAGPFYSGVGEIGAGGAVAPVRAVAARATIAAVATVAAIPTVAALRALVAAHHRRGAGLMLVDAERHVADDVLVDL